MSTRDRGNGRGKAPSVAPSEAGESRRGGGRDNVHPQAATTHGAHSSALAAPLRERHLAALRERFPNADVTILGLQATRLAQMELVGVWLDERGIMRNRRTGTTYPAADYWARVASAYERQHERLEAAEREHADGGADAYFESERRALAAGNAEATDDGPERVS